eukprot:scaffold832_cov403-Prasinococcus_capsulatus_cf.AAC.1
MYSAATGSVPNIAQGGCRMEPGGTGAVAHAVAAALTQGGGVYGCVRRRSRHRRHRRNPVVLPPHH